MKTHRERAEEAATLLFTDPPPAKEWVEHFGPVIAERTYPAELVEAARGMLRFASCDRSHRMVTQGCGCTACQYADDLRAALDLYPEGP